MPPPPVNRFGRRPGRGIRPWLLMPKIIAVAFYVGGLSAAAALWFSSHFSTLGPGDPRRLMIINQVSFLIRWMVVPALLGAIIFGVALLLQHPRQFIRMRWLQVKLVCVGLFVPSAHLFLSSRLGILRRAFADHVADGLVTRQFGYGLLAVIAISIFIVILGRLKPRLGQNWAKSYAPSQTP